LIKQNKESGVNLALVSRTIPYDLVEELHSLKVTVKTYCYDFSNPSGIPELVDTIYQDFGTINILINNAGAQRRSDSVDFSEEDWDYVINVNQKSVFFMCREVGRRMVEARSGKIINMASLLSFQGGYRVPAYTASKGAVMQFSKSLANEWAKYNVNVNCIAPGYMATDMNTALFNDPVRSEQILVRIPAGRWGNPEDLVGAALFLVSPASDYVHGITIPVDGGWLGR
jgi:2-deoxy-D-gluconate 3-dehydrogenase